MWDGEGSGLGRISFIVLCSCHALHTRLRGHTGHGPCKSRSQALKAPRLPLGTQSSFCTFSTLLNTKPHLCTCAGGPHVQGALKELHVRVPCCRPGARGGARRGEHQPVRPHRGAHGVPGAPGRGAVRPQPSRDMREQCSVGGCFCPLTRRKLKRDQRVRALDPAEIWICHAVRMRPESGRHSGTMPSSPRGNVKAQCPQVPGAP